MRSNWLKVLAPSPLLVVCLLAAGCGKGKDAAGGGKPGSGEPLAVDLAALEGGVRVESDYVRIGPHIACYDVHVAEYEAKSRTEKPTDDTAITDCYYPIISKSHPGVHKTQALEKEFGGLDKIPSFKMIDSLKPVAIVVQTKRYAKFKDRPAGRREEQQVQGRIVNLTSALSAKDKRPLLKLMREGVDPDKVLVLVESR